VPEVALTKDNHVISTLPPDRPDQPLRICVLPRRPRGCGSISDPHGANTSDEYLTIGSIAVAHEIARSLVPSTGLSKLPGDPFCGWMRGGPQPQKPTSVMPQKQQTIEKSERNRRHHEQINCSDAVRVVAQKCPPALRRWPSPPRHILRHTRLPDIDAELEQLAMDPRGSP